jgi:hypothetical protein
VLDSVQFQWHLVDSVQPAVSDFLSSAFVQHDVLRPAPSDLINAPFFPITDSRTVVPLHDGRYYHAGFTYGATQPAAVDSVLVVNGKAVEH